MKERSISGCGLAGFINRDRERVSGEIIKKAICNMIDRGNGLGSGYAAYGIYPDFKDLYAFHIMYHSESSKIETEEFLNKNFSIEKSEIIPIFEVKNISSNPYLYRYFLEPMRSNVDRDFLGLSDDDYVVKAVMFVNYKIEGAYVFSSGKNMGAFKGVGYPDDIADFYRIAEYEGYIWTAHHRFPTNTPGWWGGAHPFTLLDWSIVHNGEISSYGINKRYLEMYGYKLTLLTDTEVVAYLLDLLIRKHGLDIETACIALAPPFWKDIDEMNENEKQVYEALRITYGSALLNGPFAILFGFSDGLVGLNDRIKLRPLVAGIKDDSLYLASEESAIIAMCPNPDRIWSPRAGDPVIGRLYEDEFIGEVKPKKVMAL